MRRHSSRVRSVSRGSRRSSSVSRGSKMKCMGSMGSMGHILGHREKRSMNQRNVGSSLSLERI